LSPHTGIKETGQCFRTGNRVVIDHERSDVACNLLPVRSE
jgi:hypothetical protein